MESGDQFEQAYPEEGPKRRRLRKLEEEPAEEDISGLIEPQKQSEESPAGGQPDTSQSPAKMFFKRRLKKQAFIEEEDSADDH